MHVCMYVSIYVYVCMYKYIHACMHVCVYLRACGCVIYLTISLTADLAPNTTASLA